MVGIASALNTMASDENKIVAVAIAERWHLVLEEMSEVATKEQLQAIRVLINPLVTFLEVHA